MCRYAFVDRLLEENPTSLVIWSLRREPNYVKGQARIIAS
jgi:hypothetical protein